MFTAIHLDEVWVMNLRPMAIYHGIGSRHTQCDIPLMGFGFKRPFGDVWANFGRPCPRCFPRRIRMPDGEEKA